MTAEITRSRELVVWAVTADGRDEEIRFSVPGWGLLTLISVWGGNDRRLVLAGSGQEDDGDKAGFIGWIDANHSDRTILKIPQYAPHVMTVGPGGVIWAIATRQDAPNSYSHNVLLRFSPHGKLLTSTYLAPRNAGRLRDDGPPVNSRDVAGTSRLHASRDRVAWLTRENEYLEFDSSGTEILRLSGPPSTSSSIFGDTLAISAANTVVISRRNRDRKRNTQTQNLWSLDRIRKTWFLWEAALPGNAEVYGFNAEDLVTSGFNPQLGQLLVHYRLSETN